MLSRSHKGVQLGQPSRHCSHTEVYVYGVPCQLVAIIEELHSETWSQVRSADDTSEKFEVTTGVQQGCVVSPLLFNCFLDKTLREAMTTLGHNGGLQIVYTTSEGVFLAYR